jgi:hypothetical protein
MKIHGDEEWSEFPSYLDSLVDVGFGRLKRHGLTVTVFMVGQDAALPKNRKAMRAIADAGHEIANHSFSHEPWFHTYSYDEVKREIADAEAAIERVTGHRPRGFRGPGFSLSNDTLRVLTERGYLYDASTFPTFVGPLARAYYFFNSGDLSKEERERRKKLFGTVRDGLRDLRPYLFTSPGPSGKELLEIPVTTLPFARIPIHMSYIVYLATYSPALARAYMRAAIALVKRSDLELSFLLHPLDFLGRDLVDQLSFFPGMRAPTDRKLRLFDEVIGLIADSFETVTMSEHARVLLGNGRLKRMSLS